MKGIFKKPFFIITLAVAVILSASSLVLRINGLMSPVDAAVGAVLVPVERANSAIVNFFSGIGQYFKDYNALKAENDELKKQIRDMTEAVGKTEQLMRENDWLYNFLELKRSEAGYSIADANVISYSQVGYLASFTVDKGAADGIEKGMAVLTESGLAGCITDVGPTFSVCTATLNPNFSVGVYTEKTDRSGEDQITEKTAENCYATGNFNDAASGYMRINHLDESTKISAGDIVRTTGAGGVYPMGLYVGVVVSVEVDEFSQTLYALVKTASDVTSTSRVMIVTDFYGKAVNG